MFETIYGNEYPKQLVKSMIMKNKVIHSIILTGENGIGKLTFAKEIALQLAYHHQQNKDIKNCVDIKIINGNTTNYISINDIREINNTLNVAPHEGQKKVYIISNCDKMTIQAQNALLKSLEEPSPTTTFILTTSNTHKLLKTIISRAMIINMEKLPSEEAIKILSKEYPQNKLSDIIKYVKIFQGNIGLIKNIIKYQETHSIIDECESLLLNILKYKEFDSMVVLFKHHKDKSYFMFFLEIFKIYFKNILTKSLVNDSISDITQNYYLTKISFLDLESKAYIVDIIDQALDYISANVNLSLIITWLNINLLKA